MAGRDDAPVLYGPDNQPLEKAQYDLQGNLTTAIAPFEGPTVRVNRATPRGATPRMDLSPMVALQQINPNLWPFDPGIPLRPIVEGGGGIRWAPYAGYNVTYSPDKKIGIANSKLRAFADACPGIRIVLEQLKREFIGLEKDVAPRDPKDEGAGKGPDRERLREFLACPDPDQELDQQQWEMQVLEDLLVIGAPAIWRMHNHGGEFAGLRPIDAALVAPYVTARGTPPKPPARAYSFSAYSLPYVAYTTDELIYKPFESRTWTPYGFGPVESTIAYVLLQIYRALYYVNTYDKSDLPPGWITMPKDWSPTQILAFADEMALRFEGEQPERYHVRYMPGDSKYQQAKMMPDWDYEFDEYIMRVFAWRVGVSASPIVKQESLGKGSQGLAQEALAGGLRPIAKYVKRIFDKTFWDDQMGLTTEGEEFPRGFGIKEYEYQVVEEREENKQLKLTENSDLQANAVRTINDVRKEYGQDALDPKEFPAADEPMFKLVSGWVPLRSIEIVSAEDQRARDEAAAKAAAEARARVGAPGGTSPPGLPGKTGSEAAGAGAGEEEGGPQAPGEELGGKPAGKVALRSDLGKWQRKAKSDLKAGRKSRSFISDAIPPGTRYWVEKALAEGDLAKAFRNPRAQVKTSATSERTGHFRLKLEEWWKPRIKGFWQHFAEIAVARLTHAQKSVGGPMDFEVRKEKLNQIIKAADGDWSDPEISPTEYGELVTTLEGLYEAGVADAVDIVGGGRVSAAAYARMRAAQLIGRRWDPEVGAWIETTDRRFVISDTVRQQIQERLAAAIDAGQDALDFRSALDELLGTSIPYRASMISRTETREAYNNGAAANFQSMGVELVEIMDGSGLGDVCDEENGDVVTIEEFLAISADRHPNCTIGAAPVLMGEEEEEPE